MKSLNLLIKPSSSLCNLNCKYCFYKDCADNRSVDIHDFMNLDILEKLIITAFSENVDIINFMFQGGEPTLVGLDFYKKFIFLQNKYNVHNIKIQNSIQTNGFTLNKDWCEFFSKNNFLVGLSLDGTKAIHDFIRVDYENLGSFDTVYDSLLLLKEHTVQFNILCVIHKSNYKHIEDIYNFFKLNSFEYIQFIPCISKFNIDSNDFCMSSSEYFYFLDTLFELWYKDILNEKFIEIKNFVDYIPVLKGHNPVSCGMGGFCSIHNVIESNGDVYPCDFYCVDDWLLGNINNSSFSELSTNDISRKFFYRSVYIPTNCKKCTYFKLCGGGCRRNLEPYIGNIPSDYYQCNALRDFFDKNLKKLIYLSTIFE